MTRKRRTGLSGEWIALRPHRLVVRHRNLRSLRVAGPDEVTPRACYTPPPAVTW